MPVAKTTFRQNCSRAYKESQFNPHKTSYSNAKGMAQLTPIALKEIGINAATFNYFDPESSINAGAAYLSHMYEQFKDWPKAVAAYNAGPTFVSKWLRGLLPVYEDQKPPPRQWTDMKTYLQYLFRGDPNAFK